MDSIPSRAARRIGAHGRLHSLELIGVGAPRIRGEFREFGRDRKTGVHSIGKTRKVETDNC